MRTGRIETYRVLRNSGFQCSVDLVDAAPVVARQNVIPRASNWSQIAAIDDTLERYRSSTVGGRIDFLMRDAEAETYYEVEVMLSELDASHIIRAVEYWDIERQRRSRFTHHAVIVVEHITSRFFNILRLLNRVAGELLFRP